MKNAAVVFIFTMVVAFSASATVYVDVSVPPGGDGLSWGTAFDTIQAGINAAALASGDDVYVAQGTYLEAIVMADAVNLYGGFPTGGGLLDDRDWVANETIIDGAGADHVVIGANGVLDGFVITGGNADGGGVNNNGAGMYNDSCAPYVAKCIFLGNVAVSAGGAMRNQNAAPQVFDCLFIENSGQVGGAISNFNASPILTNCSLSGNFDSFNLGAGIFSSGVWTGVVVRSCIFWDAQTGEIFPAGQNVTYSDVQGGYADVGLTNIDADPLWVDAGAGDLRLMGGSPCVDKGDPAGVPPALPEDFGKRLRPQGLAVDMGAYELAESDLPVAAFNADVTIGYTTLTVQFTDESTPGILPIDTWAWDFGDTGSSGDPSPSHDYTAAGSFDVTLTVTSGMGSDTSDPVTIQVGEPFAFTAQPVSIMRYVNELAQFSVAIEGGIAPISYQWYFDSEEQKAPVAVGDDSPTLDVGAVTLLDDGAYWCEVTDAFDTHESSHAALDVAEILQIVSDPVGGNKLGGESHTFDVGTTGGFAPLGYEWMKDGGTIDGATQSSYTIASLKTSDAGVYSVIVSDANTNVVTSNTALLNVAVYIPAAGGLALLGLAAGLCALGGALVARKK